ncbi:MAG: hypothetical protein D3916_15055 [Candidatus Electrothrix sp. MAN1_4]|nr:hypothetical protein [Candidatus Electrothrix sp. MAN1_4]
MGFSGILCLLWLNFMVKAVLKGTERHGLPRLYPQWVVLDLLREEEPIAWYGSGYPWVCLNHTLGMLQGISG